GYYSSEEEFLHDAVLTLLAARRDLRLDLAARLYARGDISLGKAAEIADVDVEAIKSYLADKGIFREAPELPEEIRRAAEELARLAGW
ncbi:MAG: hypothetical protein DRI61_17255, partial [Chloroflexi bacterium]